jgi:predicted dehydrogenase
MTYLAALAVRLFGPAESVSARTIRDETGVDVVSAATLVHAGGALAQLGASFLSEMSNEALLSCERGVVRLAAPLLGSESVGLRRRSQPAAPAPAAAGAKARVTERLKREPLLRRARAALGESREYLPYGEDPYHAEIAHFAALIGAGRTESPVVDHALSLETARILDALRAGDGS